jgi:hypothetical protein
MAIHKHELISSESMWTGLVGRKGWLATHMCICEGTQHMMSGYNLIPGHPPLGSAWIFWFPLIFQSSMPQLFTKQQSYSISYKVFHGIPGIGVGVYIIVIGIDLARKL